METSKGWKPTTADLAAYEREIEFEEGWSAALLCVSETECGTAYRAGVDGDSVFEAGWAAAEAWARSKGLK